MAVGDSMPLARASLTARGLSPRLGACRFAADAGPADLPLPSAPVSARLRAMGGSRLLVTVPALSLYQQGLTAAQDTGAGGDLCLRVAAGVVGSRRADDPCPPIA